MKLKNVLFFSVLFGLASLGATGFALDITGAGSTFVYPILAKWADAYKKETSVSVNYQSIGSGGGIKQIQSKTVDFGASDKPMTAEELDKDGLTQFPAIIGGTVPVVNVPNIKAGELKLTGSVLADIYLGKIKKWNEGPIKALNPSTTLPDLDIAIVHRADGSGTTFIWTNYLSKVSDEWKKKVGEGTAVEWPKGVGGKGNEGVASYVQRIQGSIGYVEYAYALQNKMAYTQVQNRAHKFVQPNGDSFAAAASGAEWEKAPGFHLILTDAPGENSWPIAGTVFILVHKKQENVERGREVLKFFRWAYANGGKMATELNYVPLPKKVVQLIETKWKAEIKGADGSPIARVNPKNPAVASPYRRDTGRGRSWKRLGGVLNRTARAFFDEDDGRWLGGRA